MADKTWEMPDGIYTALVTPFAGSSVDKKLKSEFATGAFFIRNELL